jgi:hypothetical protein
MPFRSLDPIYRRSSAPGGAAAMCAPPGRDHAFQRQPEMTRMRSIVDASKRSSLSRRQADPPSVSGERQVELR